MQPTETNRVKYEQNSNEFTSSEDVGASITAQSEVVVMAIRTVGFLIFTRKRSINQRHFAVDTLKAVLVPVFFLVRQVLQATTRHCTTRIPRKKMAKDYLSHVDEK